MSDFSMYSRVASLAAPAAVGPLSVVVEHPVMPSVDPSVDLWCSPVVLASCRMAFCIFLHC